MTYLPRDEARRFLDAHVFAGLPDLNTGFDSPNIRYFSAADFTVVLARAELLGIAITGIEPWPDGVFGGVKTYESSRLRPDDPTWYQEAFAQFLRRGVSSHFAASYRVPVDVYARLPLLYAEGAQRPEPSAEPRD